MKSFEEMQAAAQVYLQEQRGLAIVQKHMHKPKRPRAIPPVPMAPALADSIPKTLLRCSHTAIALYVALCSLEATNGIIRTNPTALGQMISRGRSVVTDATLELRSAGMLQRIGRYGYVVRRTL